MIFIEWKLHFWFSIFLNNKKENQTNGNYKVVIAAHFVNVLRATELETLKGEELCGMWIIS